METKFCQSCGMPLTTEEQYGTHQDGSKNQEYCCYCFQKGNFTQNYTMEEMIAHCAQFVSEFNKEAATKFTKEQAIEQMRKFFPELKRWKK